MSAVAAGAPDEELPERQLRRQVVAPDDRPQADRDPLHDLDHPVLLRRRRGGDPDAPRADDAGGGCRPARDVQQAVHPARRDHGVLLPDPVDPGGAGQLPRAAHDRGTRPGLPEDQPGELVHLHPRRRVHPLGGPDGGVDTGWTFYTPFSQHVLEHASPDGGAGRVHRRVLVDPHRAELHRHDPQDARARADLVSAAAVRLGACTPPA